MSLFGSTLGAMRSRPYKTAPDGYVARDVGPWTRDKDHYVDRYAEMFATGMKNRWPRRAYVELFSGPGVSWERSSQEFLDGSALRALDRDFTHYAFVDRDPMARDALAARVPARTRPAARATVLPAIDCNEAVVDLRREIPANALALAFVDPTTWQVRFETIAALVDGRKVDLLMTFHTGTMQRLRHPSARPRAVDEFFGTGDWRVCFSGPRREVPAALIAFYNQRLEHLGYLPSCHLYTQRIANSRRRHMYQLVLFSKSDRGLHLWQKAIARSRLPDLRLWG